VVYLNDLSLGLFLIYINDVVKASNFNTVLYADNINLHISGKNQKY